MIPWDVFWVVASTLASLLVFILFAMMTAGKPLRARDLLALAMLLALSAASGVLALCLFLRWVGVLS